MSLFEVIVIGVSLAMDAFTVSMVYGMNMLYRNVIKQAFIAFYFGFFQALMPFIGYYVGCLFSSKIAKYQAYLSFIFLMIVAISMLKDVFDKEETKVSFHLIDLTLLSLATSMDALAIGMTFSFYKLNIIHVVLTIGLITTLLCLIALKLGKYLNDKYQDKALICGSISLMIMAFKTLCEYLLNS